MKITEKIHKVDKIIGANSYLVESGKELILIDTGMPGNGDKIIHYIEEIGKKPEDLKYIILTHPDIDHSGSVADLRAKTGAKIAIHRDDADVLAGRMSSRKFKGFLGLVFRFFSKFMKFRPVEPDILLEDSGLIGGFEIVHTPGHTPGSISLFDRKKGILFSGDALICDKSGKIRLPVRALATDFEQAVGSSRKIQALNFKILLPGHGKPWIKHGGASALQRK